MFNKKITLLILLLGVMSSSFALYKLEANYTIAGKINGPAAGIEMPIIPLFPLTLKFVKFGDKDIIIESGSSKINAGTARCEITGIEADLGIPLGLNIMNFSVGATALTTFINIKDPVDDKKTTLPAGIYAGIVGKYSNDIFSFMKIYGSAGYLSSLIDMDKAAKDTFDVNIDMKEIDASGLFISLGINIGI